jgi:hypothetical protein
MNENENENENEDEDEDEDDDDETGVYGVFRRLRIINPGSLPLGGWPGHHFAQSRGSMQFSFSKLCERLEGRCGRNQEHANAVHRGWIGQGRFIGEYLRFTFSRSWELTSSRTTPTFDVTGTGYCKVVIQMSASRVVRL